MNRKEPTRDYTQHATTLQTAIRGFLNMATLAPARRHQAAQELCHVLQEAEAALTRPEVAAAIPGHAACEDLNGPA